MSQHSSRRDFFKKVTGSMATGGVVLAASRVLANSSVADDKQEPRTDVTGYQESEHVKTYYRRVNF